MLDHKKLAGAIASLAVAGCCNDAALAQGTITVPLSNVSLSCINTANKTVDYWLLSARVPKKQTWFTDTNGVGAKVDVQISGVDKQVNFPAAASINTTDLDGKIIRASLRLHILANQDLWDPNNNISPIKTNNLNTPVTFVRRQGTSDTVKVMQTLISFTNTVGATIPANPYVQGAEMVGKLANSLLSVFQPDPTDVVDPNFTLSFGIGRVDAGCRPTELREGVGAQIADLALGGEDAGIIQTSHISDYCFYKLGDEADPNIGFSRRGNSRCATTTPTDVKTLNNPQFIWMAYGTCKDGKTCASTKTPNLNVAQEVTSRAWASEEFAALLSERIGRTGFESVARSRLKLSAPPNQGQVRAISAISGIGLCKSVGISLERCLSRNFGE